MPSDQIIPVTIEDEMRDSYIDYAMSVIVSRALPDVRDGLKPVHRRILYAMDNIGLTPDKAFKKSATIVGDVLGKYHPHGDASVYDALVRMAQDFNLRYMLVQGHGNFGSVDGDPAAAYRYTEARMTPIAVQLLEDIDKETVDFRENFDNSLKEPIVLPSKVPNLLINGSAGIAVGMATNIPPHNLSEVIDASVHLIDNPEAENDELIGIVKAPDFPTGGLIMGLEGSREAYRTGRGSVIMRAKIDVEERKSNRQSLIVKEIPYQINKARLIEQLAEGIRAKKISHVSDLRDESDRTGMRIVMELSPNSNVQLVLNQLYKHSNLQCSFGIILLALVDDVPRYLTLKEMLSHYLAHRQEVVTRRSQFELGKARARAHIVEGLRIAVDHIDEVIRIIRASKDTREAKEGLMGRFGLSEAQAQAILEMRLSRLTGLERSKLEEEYTGLVKLIAYLEDLLASPRRILDVIKSEFLEVKEKFGDRRRTEIVYEGPESLAMEDLIPEQEVVITISHSGYIKRMPIDTYRMQNRGGRGITGATLKEEDFLEHVFVTSTHHFLLFITNFGRMYRLKVYEINEASRQSKGTALINLIPIEQGERISSVVSLKEFSAESYLVTVTSKGFTKKTSLIQYINVRKTGVCALKLDKGDELVAGRIITGTESQNLLLVSRQGRSIRFDAGKLRPMGRQARGNRTMILRGDDKIVEMVDTLTGDELLVVTTKGFGTRVPLTEYRTQGRRGMGVRAMNLIDRKGEVVAAAVVKPDDEIIVVTREGQIIRLEGSKIPSGSRMRTGNILIRLSEGDSVTSLAILR
ncbi:MAG: DNA gyrase subunit A [Candidatus Eremiobacteraeota bacterium]|nr:DNA gyrase subunit A [Candidatus Eremiobacteraeota bacterium]